MFTISEAILHTEPITAEDIRKKAPELEDEEIQLIQKIRETLNGEKAIVALSPDETEYWFCGLIDAEKSREVCYLMEQDSEVGCYIGQREEFDRDYDRGDYAPDFNYCLEKSEVEIIKGLKAPMRGDPDA